MYRGRHCILAVLLCSLFSLSVDISEGVKSSVIVVSFLVAVSPILKTLTESISTDTIWAMTVRHNTHTQSYCML